MFSRCLVKYKPWENYDQPKKETHTILLSLQVSFFYFVHNAQRATSSLPVFSLPFILPTSVLLSFCLNSFVCVPATAKMSEAFIDLVKCIFPKHRLMRSTRSPTPSSIHTGILTPTSHIQPTPSPQTPSYLFTKYKKSLFEEEQIPMYIPGFYYPVEIGQKIHERYTVIGKLGYGQHSTVWLCSDAEYVCPNKPHCTQILTQTNNPGLAHTSR